MKMEIDVNIAQEMMRNYDRDYFSYSGMEAILDFYDEIGTDTEFDPIAICCDWSEYGENCCLDFDDLWDDHGSYEMNENDRDEDNDWVDTLARIMDEKTIVLRPSNGNVIVMAY